MSEIFGYWSFINILQAYKAMCKKTPKLIIMAPHHLQELKMSMNLPDNEIINSFFGVKIEVRDDFTIAHVE